MSWLRHGSEALLLSFSAISALNCSLRRKMLSKCRICWNWGKGVETELGKGRKVLPACLCAVFGCVWCIDLESLHFFGHFAFWSCHAIFTPCQSIQAHPVTSTVWYKHLQKASLKVPTRTVKTTTERSTAEWIHSGQNHLRFLVNNFCNACGLAIGIKPRWYHSLTHVMATQRLSPFKPATWCTENNTPKPHIPHRGSSLVSTQNWNKQIKQRKCVKRCETKQTSGGLESLIDGRLAKDESRVRCSLGLMHAPCLLPHFPLSCYHFARSQICCQKVV